MTENLASDFLTASKYIFSANFRKAPRVIRSIQISGYRGFDGFQMNGLGRVNLLVGKNNSGKTSVLEALHLLSSGGDLTALWQLCGRRGERFQEETSPRYASDIEIDISHLFTGHELALSSKFTISARNAAPERTISFEVGELSDKERAQFPPSPEPPDIARPRLVLRIISPPLSPRAIPLTRKGGISYDYIDTPRRLPGRRAQEKTPASHLISTDSLSGEELVRLWDKVQLTPQESLVLEALKFIDPKVEQIRATGFGRYSGERGGFIIKRSDYKIPFPLGSLGDGAWRMLAMAIVVTQSRDGVLLIDEIDTGLHYTVMADMWKLIYSSAKEFGVQVFATTHSHDCVHALASICTDTEGHVSDVTIQRIESGKNKAIPFTEVEIKMAAERKIEVR